MGSSPPTSPATLQIPSSLRECAACWRWWVASAPRSIDGRQQMELLADLEVTAKAVERVTEAIGADIARRQQETIQQAMQLELPVAVGEPIQKIYVQMDGTGLPMVAKETEGRSGKGADGRAHTREAKLACVFTQTTTDDQCRPQRCGSRRTTSNGMLTGCAILSSASKDCL